MAWLKLDDNAPHHRKMLAAGDVACWLWVCGLAYCQRHSTDGVITPEAVPFLGCTGWKSAVPKLVAAGLWVPNGSGYQVHDFLQWNDSAEERRQKIREGNERVTRFRERRKQSVSVTCNTTPSPTPQPTPTPQPSAQNADDVRGGGGRLVVSSLEREKALRHHAYVGARLKVPHKLHSDFMALTGGSDADTALRAFYAALDEEIERTGEAISPDVWKWLEGRFKPWLVARAADAEMAKFMAGGA